MAAIKFLSHNGTGTIADAIEAITYANQMGFRITNNSWGSTNYSQALNDTIQALQQMDSLFVAAAGNAGNDSAKCPFYYPSMYDHPNIISVAATARSDTLADFSNYGLTSVDIGAPGVSIYSTFPGGYRYLSGTSMAAPHVTGAAALLWEKQPESTAVEIKNAILNSADRIDQLQGLLATGARLNIAHLFHHDDIPPARVTDLRVFASSFNAIVANWTAVGDDGLEGQALRYDIRYSTSPISENNFYVATPVPASPRPALPGNRDAITIKGLRPDTFYHVAVMVFDNAGNSIMSNVASAKTIPVEIVFTDNMENNSAGWNAPPAPEVYFTNVWHLSDQQFASEDTAWRFGLDEPVAGAYAAGDLVSPVIDLSDVSVAQVQFSHLLAQEIEYGNSAYDAIGRVQVSTDGLLTKTTIFESKNTDYDGSGFQWIRESIDLSEFVGSQIQLVFRLEFFYTDSMTIGDNEWYIDDVTVLGGVLTPSSSNSTAPIANAGGPYFGDEYADIQFDGGDSYDPDGWPLSYTWSFGGFYQKHHGRTFVDSLSNAGTYQLSLVVNDGIQDSIADTTTVTISNVNVRPIVIKMDYSAYSPPQPTAGYPIYFSATGQDEDNAPLTYHWDFGDGQHATGRYPSHIYASQGEYTVSLIVNDGLLDSFAETMRISVNPNRAPIAYFQTYHTGENQEVNLSLAGYDPEDHWLSYQIVTPPQFGSISGISPNLTYSPVYQFTGTDSFSYLVNDGLKNSEVVTVEVIVEALPRLNQFGDRELVQFEYTSMLDYGESVSTPTGSFGTSLNNESLLLYGNSRKAVPYPYEITLDTKLSFDFYSDDAMAAISGIGLDTDLESSLERLFQIHGSDNVGIQDFVGYQGGWQHYEIPIGLFYTGNYHYVFFVNEVISGSNSNVKFRNVRLFEDSTNIEPTPYSINLANYELLRYGGSRQDRDRYNYEVSSDGSTLNMWGNNWKAISFPYDVEENTVIELEFKSDGQMGEIAGIGLERDLRISESKIFNLYGSQNWGIGDYKGYEGGWQRTIVPVGMHYTGQMKYLVFANDADARQNTNIFFRNVKVYNSSADNSDESVPEVIDFNQAFMRDFRGDGTQYLVKDNGNQIHCNGSIGKAIEYPYLITENSTISFDYLNDGTSDPQIAAIGFDNDLTSDTQHTISIHGTDVGETHESQGYEGGWQHYEITIGTYYTGKFQYLFFENYGANDGSAHFKNVKISEKE